MVMLIKCFSLSEIHGVSDIEPWEVKKEMRTKRYKEIQVSLIDKWSVQVNIISITIIGWKWVEFYGIS